MALSVVLASGSPQRIDWIARLGLTVTVRPSAVDEAGVATPDDPTGKVRALAAAKAHAVSAADPGSLVLAADTLVALDGETLGKPDSRDAATTMLRRLSGRPHRVLTGLAVTGPVAEDADRRPLPPNIRPSFDRAHRLLTAVVVSGVEFHDLTEEQIAAYVASGEPLGKAGSYGIQGAGGRLVARLDGCFTNVVGLPLCAAAMLLSVASGQPLACPAQPECRIDGAPRCRCALSAR